MEHAASASAPPRAPNLNTSSRRRSKTASIRNLRLVERYNVAPSQLVPVITNHSSKVQLFRWGLIPSWAKDEKTGFKMINARAETLAEKPAFRKPLERRRCLIPADGFYEWRTNPDGTKTPMYIRMRDGNLFAFAGLWETWKSPDGQEIKSCTIITTGRKRGKEKGSGPVFATTHVNLSITCRLESGPTA